MSPRRPRTDRPREAPKSRFWPRVFSVLTVGSVVLAPVATLALWLMITDPVTAAGVMERGDLLPVVSGLVKLLGKALMTALAAL